MFRRSRQHFGCDHDFFGSTRGGIGPKLPVNSVLTKRKVYRLRTIKLSRTIVVTFEHMVFHMLNDVPVKQPGKWSFNSQLVKFFDQRMKIATNRSPGILVRFAVEDCHRLAVIPKCHLLAARFLEQDFVGTLHHSFTRRIKLQLLQCR